MNSLTATVFLGSLLYSLLGVVVFSALKAVNLLRVTQEEELKGLDLGEHGQEAYAGFQIFVSE